MRLWTDPKEDWRTLLSLPLGSPVQPLAIQGSSEWQRIAAEDRNKAPELSAYRVMVQAKAAKVSSATGQSSPRDLHQRPVFIPDCHPSGGDTSFWSGSSQSKGINRGGPSTQKADEIHPQHGFLYSLSLEKLYLLSQVIDLEG